MNKKIYTRKRLSNKCLNYKSLYLDSKFIDSFGAPLTLILSKRGLGKTFHFKMSYLIHCLKKNRKMIYVVDSKVQIDTLSENGGEKFFSDIIKVLTEQAKTSNTKKKILAYFSGENKLVGEVETIKDGDNSTEIKKGLIMINGVHYGYIISLNDFARLKRNSFTEDYDRILIDEFIPETQDIRTLKNPYKLTSLIQSIFRRRNDVRGVMLANTVRKIDPILIRLKLEDIAPREVRSIYVNDSLYMVAYRIANEDYPLVEEEDLDSFSGKANILLGETSLQENEFTDEVDDDLMIPKDKSKSKHVYTIIGEEGAIRIHKVVGEYEYYVLQDYGENKTRNYCLDKKLISNGIYYRPELRDLLEAIYTNGAMKFSDAKVYYCFKSIMNIK